MTGFPTSADIYLEMDGKKVAVVQSYTTRASKSSRNVEASARVSRWPLSQASGSMSWS